MKQEDVYKFINAAFDKGLALIVTFEDGDSYPLNALDCCPSIDSEEEPIRVFFKNCEGESNTYKKAVRAGYMNMFDVMWQSEEPHEPIGCTYYSNQVKKIYDSTKDRNVFVA